MNPRNEKVADMILKRGAVDVTNYHKLKIHESDPSAPLSPFYINLRDKHNPKPGKLKAKDFEPIAELIWDKVLNEFSSFTAVAGIPRAGDPIAEGLKRILPRPFGFRFVELDKKETKTKRRIIPKKGFKYKAKEEVLLLDDLVSAADTKIEAIKAIEKEGAKVAGLVVLIDREQGGMDKVRNAGYPIHAVFTITELLDHYLSAKAITQKKYKECITYILDN